jgi:hypothetical protein
VGGILYVQRGLGPSRAAHYEGEGVSDGDQHAPAQAGAKGESREVKG